MSQSVDRLKALLFDDEAQALSDLARRVESVAEIDARGREELRHTLEQVFAQAGTQERLTTSVAEILDEALRRAEIAKHADLSRTIAPLVVTTIKSELRNSQDEMVEALYPITGRLVKSYVASAMKDLTNQMNRRLEQNPVMLRLQSLATGRSVAELALAGTQDFEIRELYLIRRGTGELVARWPDRPSSGREQTMSGVLTAINEFANEAFSASQSSLRQIDLGGEDVYLRGSPLYLLAARCSGTAPQSVEQVIDDTFLAAVEKQHEIDQQVPSGDDQTARRAAALSGAGEELLQRVAEQKAEHQQPVSSGAALKAVAALVLVPLFSWLAWSWYGQYTEGRVRAIAGNVLQSVPGMQGYPAELDIAARGRRLIVSGLAPSEETKQDAIRLLAKKLPGTNVQDRLTVVAGSGVKIPDTSPEFAKIRHAMSDLEGGITRSGVIRTSDAAERRLQQAAGDVQRAAVLTNDPKEAESLRKSAAEIDRILADLKPVRSGLDSLDVRLPAGKTASTYGRLAQWLEKVSDDLVALSGSASGIEEPRPAKLQQQNSLAGSIEQFAAEADHTATLAASLLLAANLRPPPPEPAPAIPAPAPSAREQLEALARTKAIFFANNVDYRDPAAAGRITEGLAALVKTAGVLVRVVGYTDEAGGQTRNVPLAQLRANKVRDDLLALGVPPTLLVAVGRADALDVSVSRGAYSPNRRVEFEVAFDGESQP